MATHDDEAGRGLFLVSQLAERWAVTGRRGGGPGKTVWAYGLPFAAMAALLGASFLERRARAPLAPVDAIPLHCVTSALLFTAIAAAGGHAAPPAGGAFWAAVAWTVLLSTVGGYGFYWLSLRRNGVTRTSALIYLTPPTTMVWAYAMFGDAPGARGPGRHDGVRGRG
ncbi:EamA family transporter [Streptomyces sp. NPDC005336]|uniref:EamA family transporter n=1 Tax=unclassified Streptomyces TaxID=2593676 RepID=UPI0033A3DEEB